MASEVSIANLALAHIGDTATVASLDPPEGSAQAEHCATFYPVARDALLEMHPWGFATRRIALAGLTAESIPEWNYAYAIPSDCVRVVEVLPAGVSGIYGSGVGDAQPYTIEIDSSGAKAIFTDQENARLRYIALVDDTTRFSPLFVMALSYHLASLIAGPILKGDVGAAEAKRCAALMQGYLNQARLSDAQQKRVPVDHIPSFIGAR